jgi:prepilin-type processing-associated H-X9-DG protein
MDNIKFFRILWRFNAIIIAMASIALIVASIAILYESKTRMYSQSSSVYFHDNEQTDEIEEEWFFGKMTGIRKINNTFVIPLEFTQTFSQKTTASIRNYLFVDGHTQSLTWLFPHNNFVLSNLNYVVRDEVDEYYPSSKKIIALYFIVYKADTNKDKALKTNDDASIALVKPDGSGYTELEKNVGTIIKADVINEGSHLVLFYYKGKDFYVSKYSLDDFKKVSEQRIETTGKKEGAIF